MMLLMNSNEFTMLLHSCIDPQYKSDGLLLFFGNHIHRNHSAFIESYKNKIWTLSVVKFKDNVQGFLQFFQDNLWLIALIGDLESAYNDLVPHILLQLHTTEIPIFQQSTLKRHREYMESKLQLTPSNLVMIVDDECQVLRHSNQ